MNDIEKFDVADKIIEELTTHHDVFYTIRQIHSAFYDKYEEFRHPDKKKIMIDKLKVAFLTIEGEYNNIYRIVKDDKHYLIWSLKDKDTILNENKIVHPVTFVPSDTNDYDKDLDNFSNIPENPKDYIQIITQMIDDKNFSFMYDTNFIDGKNHAIHILIMNNRLDLIQKLDDLTTIDFTVKNIEGKSCLDLAKEVKDIDMLEMILEHIYESRIQNLTKVNEILKNTQKKVYDQISINDKKITELEKKLKEASEKNGWETFKTMIISFLCLYIFTPLHN